MHLWPARHQLQVVRPGGKASASAIGARRERRLGHHFDEAHHNPEGSITVIENNKLPVARPSAPGVQAEASASGSATRREKHPVHLFEDGAVYTGQWRGDMRDGEGVQVWADGACYEGQWVKDKQHGN